MAPNLSNAVTTEAYCLVPADTTTAERIRRLSAERALLKRPRLMIGGSGFAREGGEPTELAGAEKLAVADAILALEALAASAAEPPTTFLMRMVVVSLRGRFMDAPPRAEVLDTSAQGSGTYDLRALEPDWDGAGLVAECAAVDGERIIGGFQPVGVGRSRRSGDYRLVWNGRSIEAVQDYDFELTRDRAEFFGRSAPELFAVNH